MVVTDADARIQELEARLAEFSAALGRERAAREKAAHERDQYKKLYELVAIELERVKRHLRAQNKSERVDAQQVQLAFAEIAKLVVPPEIAQAIADEENAEHEKKKDGRKTDAARGKHGRGAIPEHLPTERIEVDVPEALRACRPHGIAYDEMETSFFLGRETLVPSSRSKLGRWRRDFFISLSHSASATKTFFRIPPNRAIELGNQIQI